MIDLELTPEEQRSYHAALKQSRPMRIRARVLDRNEQVIGDLIADAGQVEGAVEIDVDADISRRLTLTIADPQGRIVLDPNSPRTSSLYADKFIAVERWDYVTALTRWIACPVFWGPVSSFQRRAEVVEVEGMGKEVLALDPNLLWSNLPIRRGTLVNTAIKRVMNEIGERRYSLAELNRRIRRDHDLGIHTEPWRVIRQWGKAFNRQLFYDGRGRLRLRAAPGNPLYTFSTGDDGNIIPPGPGQGFDWTGGSLRNVAEVIGGIPKGQKKPIRSVAKAPANHPLSPQSLARHGKPRYMIVTEEDPQILRRDEADERSAALLSRHLSAGLAVDFDAWPAPHLEELDRVLIDDDGEKFEYTLRQFSIPLSADEAQPIGAHRRVKFPRRKK